MNKRVGFSLLICILFFAVVSANIGEWTKTVTGRAVQQTELSSGLKISSPVWPGSPKIVFPGETGQIVLNVQNTNEEDSNLKISTIRNDNNIIKIKEDYVLSAGNTEIIVEYEIPSDAVSGAEYSAVLSFGVGVSESGTEISLPFLVQTPSASPPSYFLSYLIAITTVILVMVIIVIFTTRRRRRILQNQLSVNLS